MAAPIHFLPVELLAHIFQIGVDSQPTPDNREHTHLTFEVSISHVCRHWRHAALHIPHLWTTLHFRTIPHLARGDVYLNRNARLPIDVWVDTCSEHSHKLRKDLLFRDQFLPTFSVVLPHIKRWRELHLKVADLQCKSSARKVLNTCGAAPLLTTLQLWHVENWRTPERLYTAIGPPPVVVFAGELPSLKHIILQGVNLPWTCSPFLCDLTSIEFALHSDDVRMPFQYWRAMLASSPNLQRLSLLYSGPRARASSASPPDGIEWWGADPDRPELPGVEPPPSTAPVLLPNLRQVQLHDLDPEYLIAIWKSIDAPNVRALHLDLDTDDLDFTPFVEYLVAPPAHKPHVVVPNGRGHGHGHGDGNGNGNGNGDRVEHGTAAGGWAPDGRPHPRPRPKFPHLESLSIAALGCSVESWRVMLEHTPALTRLDVDFARMPEDAFDVLFGTAPAGPATAAAHPSCSSSLLSHPACSTSGHASGNGSAGHANGHSANTNGYANGIDDYITKEKGKGKARACPTAPCPILNTDSDSDHAPIPAHTHPPAPCTVIDIDRPRPILPLLSTLRTSGATGKQLRAFAAHRRAAGHRLARWEIEEGARDDETEALEREAGEEGVEEEARAAREGRAREPWRWDEPVERVVWWKEDGEGEDEEDEEEEEDADGEEESEEEGEDQ